MVRKAPKWFKDQLGSERSRYYRGDVGEAQAARNLAEQILAHPDQRFAASIIADYVRGQIDPPISRTSRATRKVHAAQLRDDGVSIRKIAERLGVGVATVHRDLRDREHSNVAALPPKDEPIRGGVWSAREGGVLLEDRTHGVPPARSKAPSQRGDLEHPDGTPDENVVPIRRSS